jgi:Heterokaryon incompatibility protein (HET)
MSVLARQCRSLGASQIARRLSGHIQPGSSCRPNILYQTAGGLGARRRFWSWRRPPPGFTYCFVDELVSSDVISWIIDCETTLKHCMDLGLWDEDNQRVRHEWCVERKISGDLNKLPSRLPHAGKYDWIGEESHEPPKWLWDSQTGRTVPADDAMLREGYIAVSYTWGRWIVKGEWRSIKGVPWRIPVVDPTRGDIADLLPILSKIPGNRYYWVDVLCIDQTNEEEKQQEIAKQGSIFAKAKGVLVYAWSIPNGHQLALALCDLGDSVLWSLRLPQRGVFLGNSATYSGRYPNGDSGELSVYYAAMAMQADPWFSSLWTMQEMVLCPSGVLMAKNGEFCTVNDRIITISSIAAAIDLGNTMMTIRLAIRFGLKGVRGWLVAELAAYLNPMAAKLLVARSEMRRRWFQEWYIRGYNQMWKDWNDQCSLDICLSADRSDILTAVTKRKASGRRGEAVLAALKVAKYEGAFDKNGLTASGLPPSLLNKILQVEGRRLFFSEALADDNSFFSDMMPNPSEYSGRSVLKMEIEWFPAENWSIAKDGSLHIPRGSVMQRPESEEIFVVLNSNKRPHLMAMSEAPMYVESAYRKWRRPYFWTWRWRPSTSRVHDEALADESPRHEDMPTEIEVKFLPILLFREPKKSKRLSELANMSAAFESLVKLGGWRTGRDDTIFGLVLASSREDTVNRGKQRRWYKCGIYATMGDFVPYELEEGSGIVVGRL